MTQRVVITGFGGLSALGADIQSTWAAIKSGQTGIRQITQWDSTDWEYNKGAELPNFDPRALISDRKLLKMLSRHDIIGLNAVEQALQHSQLLAYRANLPDATAFNERTGVYVGSPGIKFNQQYDLFPLFTHAQSDLRKYGQGLMDIVHPMWLLRILSNNVLAYTGIQYGFKGPNQNVTNHAVGGIQAIAEARQALRRGDIDRAVVVGYEAAVEPQAQIYYAALGTLSKNKLQPFDERREGTILGEGAGTLILETLTAARARGATIYGEILAGATTTEATGIFSIREDGDGLTRVMQKSLATATFKPANLGMISAHGNGTQISDATEAHAIQRLFPHQALPVTSFKWALGHTLAAAGVLETILTLQCLKEKLVPGIATLQQKAKEFAQLQVSQDHQLLMKPNALIIARGFSGLNTSLLLTNEVAP